MDLNKLKDVAAIAFQQYQSERMREGGHNSYANDRHRNQDLYGNPGHYDAYNQVAHGPVGPTDYSYSDMRGSAGSAGRHGQHQITFSDQYGNDRPSGHGSSSHHANPQPTHKKKRRHRHKQQPEAHDAYDAPGRYGNRYDGRHDNGHNPYNGEHGAPSNRRPGIKDVGIAAATFALTLLNQQKNHSNGSGGYYNDGYYNQHSQSGGGHRQNGGSSNGFDKDAVTHLASNFIGKKKDKFGGH
ncbi:hypothetical protein DL89DRAFT_327149 [Linderina pennispora]|uniref:Uncharacterized protein n=1 Tax=Linderina pennispora TaxID=61395 RepID=A0A1Y1VRX4_9FUNG|nr:uncharacterized protein DL89DRAFT_327149 [Linderina pennispora]ORX64031.1 hypothetical protein DL89DRAFT_327149 [Linderina pennispora]